MLQYLLNTTAIWLIGILFFDVFLRKENFHAYNRLYLLTILLSGVLLPLIQWEADSVIYSTGIGGQTIEQVNIVKQAISTSADKTINWPTWQQWLWGIYFLGFLVCIIRYIVEAITILRFYRNGSKDKHAGYTIIETNREINPFSIFSYIFISNTKSYTHEELEMIIAHELEHSKKWHFIDLLIARLFNTAFWFHPLAYILENRLLMIDEYQADAIAQERSEIYSKFLVDQNILGAAPIISHSFLRSPIKKRIVMLTKRKSQIARLKMLVILPVTILIITFGTQVNLYGYAPEKDGNIVTYRGNKIEYSEAGPNDTIMVEDPITGELTMRITQLSPVPIKLNGNKIYSSNELMTRNTVEGITDESSVTSPELKKHILKGLDNEINGLEDGNYILELNNIIVNDKGEVVFFEFSGLYNVTYPSTGMPVKKRVKEQIEKKAAKKIGVLLSKYPKGRPATYKDKEVPSIVNGYDFRNNFIIKDGKITNI